ncbi:hypothetical protein BH23THE1_BH23THE1_08340 [soil metagenome]
MKLVISDNDLQSLNWKAEKGFQLRMNYTVAKTVLKSRIN